MCGIFGISVSGKSIPQGMLEAAARSLAHRGPDDSGTVVIDCADRSSEVGFAHTRLSILDLSRLGHQPMVDAPSGNWIVFNGEIYNFMELRNDLEAAGNKFLSHSDTEVILAAYRTWGSESFSKLRGMFAFSIWDASLQTLLLVRDPIGIKPLYYYHSEPFFLFGSEVRTLLQTGLVPRELDPEGVLSFLSFGSTSEPLTIIRGISSVAPGHVVSYHKGSLNCHEYCNPLRTANGASDGNPRNGWSTAVDAERALPALLRDAVLSHLVSDVPVGVFLSGGIDSSALVAVMSRAGVRPVTFSLVFREAEFDEAQHSREVARKFRTDHHEIMISQEDALAALPDALRSMDQPTIDGINTWLVSRKTRAEGVKVALTGLGADEIFAGYSNFSRVPRMEKAAANLARIPSPVRRPVAATLAALSGKSDRNRKLSELASADVHPYFLVRNLFTLSEREALFAGDFESAERNMDLDLARSIEASRALDPVNRVSYLESTWYMRNTLLRDSDFMSMAHGLELRVPFLDRTLVEACFLIPGSRKLRNGSPKSLLLESIGTELPKEIVNRPKRGFTLPFEQWLRREMKPVVETTLLGSGWDHTSINASGVRDVWSRFLEGETSWSRPWSMFVLKSWCDQNL